MNPTKEQQQVLDSNDFFDTLPDEIVLCIFKKLHDAKSLCQSMSVCKRFYSIAPQVDQIFLSIPTHQKSSDDHKQETTQKSSFKNFVTKALIKPFNFITQMIKLKSKNSDHLENNDNSDHQFFKIPDEILNPFEQIRSLHLQLPCPKTGENGNNNNSATFLKWKAEFGKELQSCVMLGAKSLINDIRQHDNDKDTKAPESSRIISDEELKLRIVWTISCLIAASARHCLIRETLNSHKMIESLVISDENEQGRVCMNRGQVEEFRGKDETGDFDDDELLFEFRRRVPALRMKMWYLERLELIDSCQVMEGATLVVVTPAGGGEVEDGELVRAAFGGEGEGVVVEEAVRKLMVANKCYTLEMNSF